MIKTAAIVSLSSGIIGESFVSHEIEIGMKRLEEYGLKVKLMPHAMKGLEYVKNHPESRAEDLLEAFRDDEVDLILCAIGGDDTYRLLPALFADGELKEAVKEKVFLGFSDTTFNHLMLHKVGLNTFYGQAFFSDICELDKEMLPYSEKYFRELLLTGTISEITPADVWYEERESYGPEAVGTPRVSHPNEGFIQLQGPAVFSGEILGGCIDSIYDIFDNTRYSDTVELCERYELFPSKEDWQGKILLLETSEEQPAPELYEKMLLQLKSRGVFDAVSGVLCGKPINEKYMREYMDILVKVVDNPGLPVVCNLNIGHATPRCIIPFGVPAAVDAEKQIIKFYN